MQHLDFSDFSLVQQLAQPELSGCPRATITETAALVFSQFCEATHCFREHIDLTVTADVADYDLVSPHPDTLVVGVQMVQLNNSLQLPGNYIADAPGRITFTDGQSGNCRATVLLKPMPTAQAAPAELLNRWAETIASGVKRKLMLMPEKPWSNPQMAGYYQDEYERDCLRIAADVRNQFSVSRTGRAEYSRSVYGV